MPGFTIRFVAESQAKELVCLLCGEEIWWSEKRYYWNDLAVCATHCCDDVKRILTALGIEHEFVEEGC